MHYLQKTGASINWSNKKQQTAAILTNEAEYRAIAAAVHDALYLKFKITSRYDGRGE